MDDEEEEFPQCPLCLEELDATDRAVEACQCGYQVCLWCLHHIREQLNGKCPACRTPYQEQNFRYAQVDPEEAAKEAKERATAKKEKERREKFREIEKERARSAAVSQRKAKNNLKHARILQKNLVYVIGLSLTLAREEVIRRADMFGKFGRMMRILVNRSHPFNVEAPGGPSISAYVQYVRDSDASAAVRAMNNAVFDGREIRCALATTKYCDSFLRNSATSDPNAAHFCGNQNCMYYHSLCQERTLTREEVLARQLGPPPPGHLFLPADNRRPQTMLYQHSRIALMPSSPHSRGIMPPRTNPLYATADGSMAKLDNNRIPLHSSLAPPNVSTSFVALKPSNPSSRSTLRSPVASPQRPGSFARQGAVLSRSPLRTPPSSPPAKAFHQSGMNRSLYMQGSFRYHHPSTEPTGSAPGTHVSCQARSGAIREVERKLQLSKRDGFPLKHDLCRPREMNNENSARGSMPPGFEELFASKMPLYQSRPPGFDVAVGSHIKTCGKSERAIQIREISKPMPSIPPPGFSGEPIGKKGGVRTTTTDFAAAWSQEASTDQVFSAQTSRVKNQGAIGQFPARIPIDEIGKRSDLANVLAIIGGNLGVSTEFQARSTSSTAVDSAHDRPTDPVLNFNASYSFSKPQQNAASLHPLFRRDMAQISPHHVGKASQFPSLSKAARPPPLSLSQYPEDSGTSVPIVLRQGKSAELSPMDHTFSFRRSRSRFGFARDDPSEEGRVLKRTFAAGARPSIMPNSHQKLGINMESPAFKNMSNMGPPTQYTSSALPCTGVNPVKLDLDQRPVAAKRQLRSRFDFADDDSSQMRNLYPPYKPYTAPGTRYATGHYKRCARNVPSDSGSSVSFATLSTEEKLASLFHSAQSSAQPLPPMPSLDAEQEAITNFARGDEAASRPGASKADMVPLYHERKREPESSKIPVQSSMELQRTHRREQIDSAPPGFHEATAEERRKSSSASNEVGESTGEKTYGIVVKGCASLQNTPKEGNDVSNDFIEERRRSRAQKKKEKKVRQLKEAVDRKASTTSGSCRHSSPVHVRQPTDATATLRLPQTSQTSDVLLVTSTADALFRQPVLPIAPGSLQQIYGAASIAIPPIANEESRGQHRDADQYIVSDHNSNSTAPCLNRGESETVVSMSAAANGIVKEEHKFMSVSELEKEVEAARAREAQLQDKLLELQKRIRSYDNVRS